MLNIDLYVVETYWNFAYRDIATDIIFTQACYRIIFAIQRA